MRELSPRFSATEATLPGGAIAPQDSVASDWEARPHQSITAQPALSAPSVNAVTVC